MGDDTLERILAWLASVVAVGLLGAGVYAVFDSKDGSGTVALLTVGSLGLFVIVFRDRIRSLEFGGARIRLAQIVRDSINRAWRLRLKGDYERAEAEIEFIFDNFVKQEPPKVQQAYNDSMAYQRKVLTQLGHYVQDKFKGRVLETSSTVSFLPLIDAVMTVDGSCVQAELKSHGKILCEYLTELLKKDKELRAAVIVRPGPALDTEKLVYRLNREVTHGALGVECFLLIQNSKHSKSGEQFCDLAKLKDLHAKSIAWDPGGSGSLADAFLQAILTICDPSQCPFSQATVTRHNSASQATVTMN